MVEPKNIPRDEFPKSSSQVNGMISLNIICDNNEMNYIPNIEYIDRDGTKLYIQLILPDKTDKKFPLIVYVQGSAFHWQNVYKSIPHLCLLANRGFAIASVQYRGSDMSAFPAQMLDVKIAIRFMKLNADKYNIDVDKVYLMGDSSGGHTAMMAGLTVGIEQFEENIYNEVTSNVLGIINFFGPVNIAKMNDELSSQNHILPDSPEGFLIGKKNVLENLKLVEPTVITNYITPKRDIPPILIFHGTNDELVPFGQSCMLYDKLKECEKRAKFYAIEGAHHGGKEFWSNQVLDIIENFIQKNEL